MSARRRGLALLALGVLGLGSVGAPSPSIAADGEGESGDAEAAEATRAYLYSLRLGWSFFDVGNLSGALEAFQQALGMAGGANAAEVHYALSAVWWQRRNAFASHSRLADALRTRGEAWDWDSGEDGEWDHRIESRLRYIERNFAAVRLRPPQAGRALPPLPDPPRKDPLLRSFANRMLEGIAEIGSSSDGVRYVFLPAGRYWVGEDQRLLQAGHLDPAGGEVWDLIADRGRARKEHRDRLAAIEAEVGGEASTKRRLAARDEPAPGRPMARDARASTAPNRFPPADPPGPEPAAVSLGQAEAPEPTRRSRPPIELVEQRPIEFAVVRSYTAATVSEEISEVWHAPTFHLQYVISCPSLDSEHELGFPDHGFYVRFDPGAELRIQGAEKLLVRLRSDWLVGGTEVLNYVDLWFDGTSVLVAVNGVEFGPVVVRDEPFYASSSRWQIQLRDGKARISHLRVEPWYEYVGP